MRNVAYVICHLLLQLSLSLQKFSCLSECLRIWSFFPGEFADTDKCCREHDHCPHVIHAFSTDYGYTNFKWHSISHCDCDNT